MHLNRPFATVTPTLDGDVLSVLAASDAALTIPQVQRIVTTASGEGIRKVLKRLVTQGVVVDDQVGRTKTYRVNTEHVAAEAIQSLARLKATFLGRLESHLKGWSEAPRYAAVFGTAATGSMTPDGCIDLFLVRAGHSTTKSRRMNPGAWEHQLTELVRSVSAWTGNDARISEYPEAKLGTAAATGDPLLTEVATTGLTVAGTRAWLTRKIRQPREPLAVIRF